MAYACTANDKCTGSPFYGAYATADVPVVEPCEYQIYSSKYQGALQF